MNDDEEEEVKDEDDEEEAKGSNSPGLTTRGNACAQHIQSKSSCRSLHRMVAWMLFSRLSRGRRSVVDDRRVCKPLDPLSDISQCTCLRPGVRTLKVSRSFCRFIVNYNYRRSPGPVSGGDRQP